MSDRPRRKGWLAHFLRMVEVGGNALPHPATLFLIFAVAVVFLSWIASLFELEVVHPGTGEVVRPVNLLSEAGLHRILGNMVTNFTDFAPLGTVLVALLGIGVAESSGLIGTGLRLLVTSAPRKLLTAVIVFAGVLSNMASEIGYVLLVPLGATIFQAAGRHPIAGLAAAFAGVSGGYSANFLLGTIDPLLSGLTQEAARILEPGAEVNPACNYFFMFVSTFVVVAVGTWVTERIVAPRLGEWSPADASSDDGGAAAANADGEMRSLTHAEKRGLWWALGTTTVFVVLLVWSALPVGSIAGAGFLRDPSTGELLRSPFMSSIVALIFLAGALAGLAYGVAAGTIRNDSDVMKGMSEAMRSLGSYLVLVFFAAQFVAYFNWTNLGLILAVEGAEVLKASGLGGIPLLIALVVLTAFMNLFLGSASAKWAVMAPVLVPMFMLLGYEPSLIQAAYRVGDSCTNIISPMMSYFALIIAFLQRYDRRAGIGTLVATMLPYTVAFMVAWSALLGVWIAFDFPLGF